MAETFHHKPNLICWFMPRQGDFYKILNLLNLFALDCRILPFLMPPQKNFECFFAPLFQSFSFFNLYDNNNIFSSISLLFTFASTFRRSSSSILIIWERNETRYHNTYEMSRVKNLPQINVNSLFIYDMEAQIIH